MTIRAGIAISIKDALFVVTSVSMELHPLYICVQAILVNAGIWDHKIIPVGRDLRRLLAQPHAQSRDSSKVI